MDSLIGPMLVAAALLALAGAQKLVDPLPTQGALRAIRLPSRRGLVRILAIVEVAVGASVVAFGGPVPALALGTVYLAFTGFVAAALLAGTDLASCGCFGRDDTPPAFTHLLLNAALAGCALVAAATGVGSTPTLLAEQPAAAVPLVIVVVVATGLAVAVYTVLPRTLAVTREVSQA